MLPTTWFLLILSLTTGTMITMSSSHWLLAWIGLELNTLAIIPIITKMHHPRTTEAAIKYFLTQAMASALIMFSSTLNAWITGQWTITQLQYPPATMMLTLALAMKLGLVPIHFWLPEVMQGTTINTAMLLTTWQKIAPLTLLCMMTNHLNIQMLLTLSLLSTLMGGMTGLNQTQTRKIMAYSSITHMGWLLITLIIAPNLALLTMLFYLLMTITMFMTLNTTSAKTITDLGPTWTHSPTITALMMFTLLSLGGLPPMSGFAPKWLILKEMVSLNLMPICLTMALASLLSLFFYLRLAHLTVTTAPPTTTTTKHNWRYKPQMMKMISTQIMASILLLPLLPLLQNTT
uniref:NADH-ubiquinone oxidoreductase chain 2 n=1 Tax=Holodactylus africanus TaxID=96743 RepID=A9ZP03_9SAUR|nr:NADH dehydrogenase subunit 2 [Holodactylus africanus]